MQYIYLVKPNIVLKLQNENENKLNMILSLFSCEDKSEYKILSKDSLGFYRFNKNLIVLDIDNVNNAYKGLSNLLPDYHTLVCSNCGNHNVSSLAFVDSNTLKYTHNSGDNLHTCNDCGETDLITYEKFLDHQEENNEDDNEEGEHF